MNFQFRYMKARKQKGGRGIIPEFRSKLAILSNLSDNKLMDMLRHCFLYDNIGNIDLITISVGDAGYDDGTISVKINGLNNMSRIDFIYDDYQDVYDSTQALCEEWNTFSAELDYLILYRLGGPANINRVGGLTLQWYESMNNHPYINNNIDPATIEHRADEQKWICEWYNLEGPSRIDGPYEVIYDIDSDMITVTYEDGAQVTDHFESNIINIPEVQTAINHWSNYQMTIERYL